MLDALFLQMWAMSCNSFGNIPYDLLFSCLKHPYLTVHRLVIDLLNDLMHFNYLNANVLVILRSEKHLSDALLAWLSVNSERSAKDDCSDILKQVKMRFNA